MIHVVPVHDFKPHFDLTCCHCGPKIEIENGEMMICHQAFDKRGPNPGLLQFGYLWVVVQHGYGSGLMIADSVSPRLN